MNKTEALLMLQAAELAASVHANQVRDGTGMPYIDHPLKVAGLLLLHCEALTQATVVAAILHDTIEDSPEHARPRLADFIARTFSPEVLDLVLEVTDAPGPVEQRRAAQLEKAPRLSPGACRIKLADKYANLHDLEISRPWPAERMRAYAAHASALAQRLKYPDPRLLNLVLNQARIFGIGLH